MMLFEMQSKMTRDWFAAIETSTRLASEACMAVSKDTTKAWETALSELAPRPVSPLTALWSSPWTDAARGWPTPAIFGASYLPAWTALPQLGWSPTLTAPNWGTTWSMLPFWPSPSPAMGAWPFNFATAVPSPMQSTFAMQDAFATAYQTASGYAMARILDAPAQAPRRAVQSPWQFDWGVWGFGR